MRPHIIKFLRPKPPLSLKFFMIMDLAILIGPIGFMILVAVKFVDQVWAMQPHQLAPYRLPHFRLIPEEKLALGKFLFLCVGREDFIPGVGMDARVVNLGRHCHWGRGEILNLFELEIQVFRDACQLCHVCFAATGMRRYEIGDELLLETIFTVHSVEYILEFMEEVERWFAHAVEHFVGGVLRGHFQSAAHMVGNKFLHVDAVGLRNFCGVGMSHGKVVSDTAAHKRFLHSRQGIHAAVYVGEKGVVSVEIRTRLRMQA